MAGAGHPERKANPSHTVLWNRQVQPQQRPKEGTLSCLRNFDLRLPKLPPPHKTSNTSITKLASPSSYHR